MTKQTKETTNEKTIEIKLISIFLFISGLALVAQSIICSGLYFNFFSSDKIKILIEMSRSQMLPGAIILFLVGILSLFLAIKILKLKEWTRITLIVLLIASLISLILLVIQNPVISTFAYIIITINIVIIIYLELNKNLFKK